MSSARIRARPSSISSVWSSFGTIQLLRDLLQILERPDLPGDVVQPDGLPSRQRRPSRLADREQPEVVVVVGVRGLEELRARHLHHDPEPEHVPVELVGLLGVTHVQDGVVHPLDRHQSIGPRPSFSRPIFAR